jgi:hypothetical protein
VRKRLSARLFGVCLLALLVAMVAGVMCSAKTIRRGNTVAAPAKLAVNWDQSGMYLGYDQATKQWGWTAYVRLDGSGFENNKYGMYLSVWDANLSKQVSSATQNFNPYGQGYDGGTQSRSFSYTIPLESPWGQAILWYGMGCEFSGELVWDDPTLGLVNIKSAPGTVYPDP